MPVVSLQPMTPEEFTGYLARAVDGYARDMAATGVLPAAAAQAKARADFDRLLPDGIRTPGQLLFTSESDGRPVGLLWLAVQRSVGADGGVVYDVQVTPAERGRGYGRAVMLAAEDECRRRGIAELHLNVFGQNAVARRLYDSLGYQVTSTQMRKSLA